jgi:hypothetical protein
MFLKFVNLDPIRAKTVIVRQNRLHIRILIEKIYLKINILKVLSKENNFL